MRNLDLCFGSEAGGRTLVNTSSCSPRVECPTCESIITYILYCCLPAAMDLYLTVSKLFHEGFLNAIYKFQCLL